MGYWLKRTNRMILLTALIGFAWSNYLFAASASADSGVSRQLTILFGLVIIIAVAVGLILSITAARESEIKGDTLRTAKSQAEKESQRNLDSAIYQQIGSLTGSSDQRKEVAGTILNMVNDAMEKRTDSVKAELAQKYSQIINEKKQEVIEFKEKYNAIQGKYKDTVMEKRQTESVVRSIAEGLVVVNVKGEVILMNPAAEKMLDVNSREKIGKPLLDNVKDEQLISLVKDSSQGGKEIELTSMSADTKKILRSSSAVIEDENGKTVGMVSVLSDITKQRELEKLKSDFVSTVSHELRTPLATIQNSIALILEKSTGPLTENQEKFLSIVKRNLERLQHIISDILDLSKIEEKKMPIELKPSSIEEIIKEVYESMRAWAAAKSIEIQPLIQPGLPRIRIDPLRIIQVINNILGNAVKFTPRNGRIIIEAKFQEGDKNIAVSVADNGIGIAKEDLPKVFDKFQQVGERNLADIGGSGLGLSIAKEIIELHNGKIWVESEKGKGAKFIFSLPV